MKNPLCLIVILISLAISNGQIQAQDTVEKWSGELSVMFQKLTLELHIKKDADGKLTGEMVSVSQGGIAIPFDTIEIRDNSLKWEIKKIGASYNGTINDEGTEVEGTFKQGREYKVKFKKIGSAPAPKHIQTWQGTMIAGPQTFDFQFRIFDADGVRSVRLDSFSEQVPNLPGTASFDGQAVKIELPITKAVYEGQLNAAGNEIVGKWKQRGNEFDLTLTQIPLNQTREITQKRPQTPKPPFDYLAEEVSVVPSQIDSKYEKDVKLVGALTTPKGPGPFPAVILINGSGPHDRDETIFGHKPFFVIADHLAKNGIATLRYDERGVAKSVGNYAQATSVELAADAEALFDWLQQHERINANKIALVGHSEGGLIAPMISARNQQVAAIVMLAGPGVPGRQIIMNQSRLIASAAGASESDLKFQDELLESFLTEIEKPDGLTLGFMGELTEKLAKNPPEGMDGPTVSAAVQQAYSRLANPWMKFFVEYDPAGDLRKTRCPVLAVVGEKDTQVDPQLNMPAIQNSLKAGGNQDFELKTFPNLNHLFQNCEKGTPDEYAKIEETFDKKALKYIGDWLMERLK